MTKTIITMSDGSKWKPSTSSDTVHGEDCDKPWKSSEKRSTSIILTAPEAVKGEA